VLRATPQITEFALAYREAQQRRQKAETEELLARNQLGAIIRSADRAKGDFGSVGWVRPSPKQITNWEALARSINATAQQIARYTHAEQDQAYVRAWWSRKADQQ
jgi:hypothetical protein